MSKWKVNDRSLVLTFLIPAVFQSEALNMNHSLTFVTFSQGFQAIVASYIKCWSIYKTTCLFLALAAQRNKAPLRHFIVMMICIFQLVSYGISTKYIFVTKKRSLN